MDALLRVDQAATGIVRTQRLTLRPLFATDLDEFTAFYEDSMDAFAPWSPAYEPGTTPELLARTQIERTAQCERTGSDYKRVGVLEDGTIVGTFNLNLIARGVFENAFAGWAVRAPLQRQGFATEGLRALLDLAFSPAPDGVGLHRVQANIVPDNIASLGVVRKCGLRKEGLARAYLKINGAWRDHIMFAVLRDEWAERTSPHGPE